MKRDKKVSENNDLQTYKNTPITSFGESMLFRMGLDVSKLESNEQKFKVVPRQARMGLGADSDQNNQKREKYNIGDTVYVIDGIYQYKKGNIAKIESDKLRLELQNGMEIKVKVQQVVKQNKLKHKSRSRSRSHDNHKCIQKEQIDQQDIQWIVPQIRVRIINETFSQSYMKKAIVIDVNKYDFSVQLENRQIIENVIESDIETVIPKVNNYVMILIGQNKGEQGRLINKNNNEQIGRIELNESLEIVESHYNCMTEYMNQ